MKQVFYLLILTFFFSCHTESKKTIETIPVSKVSTDTIKLRKLKKLFAVGDFDGDGKKDTISEHYFSGPTKTETDSAADPFQHHWDSVVSWFYRHELTTCLVMDHRHADTLHLGISQGVYCLINMGDNNADGKDEIAFVTDYLDFSRVNSCKIYTLCDHKWTALKQFGIYEGAFDITTEKQPAFTDIKEHLEKQHGKWFFSDYSQSEYENEEDVGKMIPLSPGKCR